MREIKRQRCRHRHSNMNSCILKHVYVYICGDMQLICMHASLFMNIWVQIHICRYFLFVPAEKIIMLNTFYHIPPIHRLGNIEKVGKGIKKSENQEVGCEVVSSRYNMESAPMKLQQ